MGCGTVEHRVLGVRRSSSGRRCHAWRSGLPARPPPARGADIAAPSPDRQGAAPTAAQAEVAFLSSRTAAAACGLHRAGDMAASERPRREPAGDSRIGAAPSARRAARLGLASTVDGVTETTAPDAGGARRRGAGMSAATPLSPDSVVLAVEGSGAGRPGRGQRRGGPTRTRRSHLIVLVIFARPWRARCRRRDPPLSNDDEPRCFSRRRESRPHRPQRGPDGSITHVAYMSTRRGGIRESGASSRRLRRCPPTGRGAFAASGAPTDGGRPPGRGDARPRPARRLLREAGQAGLSARAGGAPGRLSDKGGQGLSGAELGSTSDPRRGQEGRPWRVDDTRIQGRSRRSQQPWATLGQGRRRHLTE